VFYPDLGRGGVEPRLYVVRQRRRVPGDGGGGEAYVRAVGFHPAGCYGGLGVDRNGDGVAGQPGGVGRIDRQLAPVIPTAVEPLVAARRVQPGGAAIMVQRHGVAGDVGGIMGAGVELAFGVLGVDGLTGKVAG